jgi:isocitrate/isopropylmalate dehydrogenase
MSSWSTLRTLLQPRSLNTNGAGLKMRTAFNMFKNLRPRHLKKYTNEMDDDDDDALDFLNDLEELYEQDAVMYELPATIPINASAEDLFGR